MKITSQSDGIIWVTELEKVSLSLQKAKTNHKQHSYLAIKNGDISVFEDLGAFQAAGYRKMKISEIVEASKIALKNSNNPVISHRICKAIECITYAKHNNFNKKSKQVGRFFLEALKVISYISVIGIPIGLIISLCEKTFFAPHKADISVGKAFSTLKIDAETSETIRNDYPKILIGLSSELSQNDIESELNAQITIDMGKKHEDTLILAQFWKDYRRDGFSFTLYDNNIKLKSTLIEKGKSDERVTKEFDRIATLIKDDPEWLEPLQTALSQTSSNAAANYLICSLGQINPEKLNAQIYDDNKLKVHILRDESGKITSMKIKVIAKVDVFHTKRYRINEIDTYLIANKIGMIVSKLNYTLILDEKKVVVKVEDLKFDLKINR